MNKYKYCNCNGYAKKAKRLYVRRTFHFETGYKRKFVAIGYICESCNEIVMDNDKKYIPFDKYHILEFDHNQLLKNIEKISLAQD